MEKNVTPGKASGKENVKEDSEGRDMELGGEREGRRVMDSQDWSPVMTACLSGFPLPTFVF